MTDDARDGDDGRPDAGRGTGSAPRESDARAADGPDAGTGAGDEGGAVTDADGRVEPPDPGDTVATVEADGVRVRKSTTPTGFDRPAVRFDVAATGDGGRTVRVVERLPSGVDPDALRFDAEYAGDGWRPARPAPARDADGDAEAEAYGDPGVPDEDAADRTDEGASVEFRTVLGPGDAVTTYYVPPSSGPALDDYDAEPRLTVERLGGGEGGGLLSRVAGFFTGGSTPDAASSPTRSTSLGDEGTGDDGTGADDGTRDDGTRDDDGPDRARATARSGGESPVGPPTGDDREDEDGDEDEDERDGTVPAGGLPASLYGAETLGDALAAEVEAGRLEPGTLRALADDAAVDADRAVRVRVERLETRVSELEAYAGALESFLVDGGTAEEVREALSRLDDLAARVEATASDAEDARRRVETVERHVEELATGLEAEDDAVVSLQADVEDLREEVESLAAFRRDVARVLTLPGEDGSGSGGDGRADGADGDDGAGDDGDRGNGSADVR